MSEERVFWDLVRELKHEGPVGLHLLGTRLMALSGLSTRTVLTADKLTFWRLREYSNMLQYIEVDKEREGKYGLMKQTKNFHCSS